MTKKRGRKPIPLPDQRRHPVTCRLTDAELEKVDRVRGQVTRGEFIRRAALSRAPRPVPSVNVDQWQKLARASANLNQLVAAINAGKVSGVNVDLSDLKSALDEVRAALIGLDLDGEGADAEG